MRGYIRSQHTEVNRTVVAWELWEHAICFSWVLIFFLSTEGVYKGRHGGGGGGGGGVNDLFTTINNFLL